MKKIKYSFLLWISFSTMLNAFQADDIPNKMSINQHWMGYTSTFDIGTKTRKLGTLYRRVLNIPLTYDFYDESDHLLTTVKSGFLGTHVDIYDDKNKLLGSVDNNRLTFSKGFVMYSPASVRVARAGMNFWGTTLSIYDASGDIPIVIMSRSFFRIKNYWTINVKDKRLFESNTINPDFFVTVLALQGAQEYWSKQHNKTINNEDLRLSQQIQEKIDTCMHATNLTDIPLMDACSLDILAAKLDHDYQNQLNIPYDPSIGFNSMTKINDFVDFCLNMVQSEQLGLSEKKATLYLLQQRMIEEG